TRDHHDVDTAAPRPLNDGRFTTIEMLHVERSLLTTAIASRHSDAGIVAPATVDDHLSARPDLTDEQADMVRTLTTSGDGVDVVVGRAGTGKTYALAAAADIWRAAGYTPIGV